MGAAMLLVVSVYLGRTYERYCERTLAEMSEILRMLSHIRGKICAFLCPQSSLLSDFYSDALTDAGFLCKVRDGATLKDAFEGSKLSLSRHDKRALGAYFADFGKRYKSEEISRLDEIYRTLDESFKSERERVPKDVKIAKTLLIAASLGISVLMI